MRDLEAIIPLLGKEPEFREWNVSDPNAIDWETYYRIHGRVEQAIYWNSVFAPHFVFIQGMILRQRIPARDYTNSPAPYSSSTATATEFLTNHLHVSDLFYNDRYKIEYDYEVYLYLAERIAESWRHRLKALFPDEKIDVIVDAENGDLQVYAITVREDDSA